MAYDVEHELDMFKRDTERDLRELNRTIAEMRQDHREALRDLEERMQGRIERLLSMADGRGQP